MARIIHHQSAISHLLLDQTRNIRIGIARCRRLTLVCIPVYLIDPIARMFSLHKCCNLVSRSHVSIVITIVTHHANDILPCTCMRVGSIVQGLIHQYSCFLLSTYRKAAYSHIWFALISYNSTTLLLNLFLIIKQAEEIVAHITVHMTERVLAFIAE